MSLFFVFLPSPMELLSNIVIITGDVIEEEELG
jgi:hypothetical protein